MGEWWSSLCSSRHNHTDILRSAQAPAQHSAVAMQRSTATKASAGLLMVRGGSSLGLHTAGARVGRCMEDLRTGSAYTLMSQYRGRPQNSTHSR